MGKVIDGTEYNYEITYMDGEVKKVISRATTSAEADRKLELARGFLPAEQAATCQIEAL